MYITSNPSSKARQVNEQSKEARQKYSTDSDGPSVDILTLEEQLLSLHSQLPGSQRLNSHRRESIANEAVESSGIEEHVSIATSKIGQTLDSLAIARLPSKPLYVVPDLIEKVVATSSLSWTMVGLSNVEKTVMLLKNGMAYIGLTDPPGSLQLPETPDGVRWVTWRQEKNGLIYIVSASGESLLNGVEVDTTPLTNQDIVGVHTDMQAEVHGATMVTTWRDVHFNLDGTFELSKSILTTTGGAGTMLTDILTSSFHQQTAGLANDTAGSAPNKHLYGTYELKDDGFSIEMSYTDGSVERDIIYQNAGYLYLGSSSYAKQEHGEEYLNSLREDAVRFKNGERVVWLSLLADSIMDSNRKSFDTRTLPSGIHVNSL